MIVTVTQMGMTMKKSRASPDPLGATKAAALARKIPRRKTERAATTRVFKLRTTTPAAEAAVGTGVAVVIAVAAVEKSLLAMTTTMRGRTRAPSWLESEEAWVLDFIGCGPLQVMKLKMVLRRSVVMSEIVLHIRALDASSFVLPRAPSPLRCARESFFVFENSSSAFDWIDAV